MAVLGSFYVIRHVKTGELRRGYRTYTTPRLYTKIAAFTNAGKFNKAEGAKNWEAIPVSVIQSEAPPAKKSKKPPVYEEPSSSFTDNYGKVHYVYDSDDLQ